MKYVILAAKISDSFRKYLEESHLQLMEIDSIHELSTEKYSSIIGIVTSNKLQLNATTLANFASLVWIARLGSGMEIIDQNYCDLNNIHCFSSPKGIANSVAEHAVGMLLCLQHRIHHAFNEISSKQWNREPNRGIEIEDMTLGIIGYGHTGKAFAQKMKSFTNNILAYDKYNEGFGNEHIQEVALADIKAKADIISFHLPLTSETEYYYNDNFIASVKKPHIIINTSRGKIAKTESILKGLASKKIIGACLDVLEEEKFINQILQQEENSIEKLSKYNVILTPHIAGYSHKAIEKMSEELMEQIQRL